MAIKKIKIPTNDQDLMRFLKREVVILKYVSQRREREQEGGREGAVGGEVLTVSIQNIETSTNSTICRGVQAQQQFVVDHRVCPGRRLASGIFPFPALPLSCPILPLSLIASRPSLSPSLPQLICPIVHERQQIVWLVED